MGIVVIKKTHQDTSAGYFTRATKKSEYQFSLYETLYHSYVLKYNPVERR